MLEQVDAVVAHAFYSPEVLRERGWAKRVARADRRLAAGGFHHVHNRAVQRRPLFAGPADRLLFVATLREALARHEVELLAWCLMPNHWHLLVRAATVPALPAFMRWLTLAHSRRWQAMHGEVGLGTLYQGRYRSHPVDGDGHLLTVARYIERNPVGAGLVERAADWPWSSTGERRHGRGGLLAPLPVPLPADWEAWLDRPETPTEIAVAQRRRGRPPTGERQGVNAR